MQCIHPWRRSGATVAILLTVPIAAAALSSEDPPDNAEPSDAVKVARAHMSQFKVHSRANGEQLKMLPNPLMIYGDAARNNQSGTVWAWGSGESGRPAAILELYRNTGTGQPWVHAMTLTSPDLIQLDSRKVALRTQGYSELTGGWQPAGHAVATNERNQSSL
jgi:hypothetical protein